MPHADESGMLTHGEDDVFGQQVPTIGWILSRAISMPPEIECHDPGCVPSIEEG
jgi:hypothetical protein